MNKDAQTSTSTKTGKDSKTAASRTKSNKDPGDQASKQQRFSQFGQQPRKSVRHSPEQLTGLEIRQRPANPGQTQRPSASLKQGSWRGAKRANEKQASYQQEEQRPVRASQFRDVDYRKEVAVGTMAYMKAKERIDMETWHLLPRFYDHDQMMRDAMKFCMQRFKLRQNKNSAEHRDTLIDFNTMKVSFFDPNDPAMAGRNTIRTPAVSTFESRQKSTFVAHKAAA